MSAGKSVGLLFYFAIGFMFLGGLYRLFNEGVLDWIIETYYIQNDSMDLLVMFNNIVPIGLFFVGILCMVIYGFSARSVQSEADQVLRWIAAGVVLIFTMGVLVLLGMVFFNAWYNPTTGLEKQMKDAAESQMDAEGYNHYLNELSDYKWFFGLVFVVCAAVAWVIYIVWSLSGSAKEVE